MSHIELLTTRDVAAALGVSTREIARRVENGALEPVHKMPGIRGGFLFDPSVTEPTDA